MLNSDKMNRKMFIHLGLERSSTCDELLLTTPYSCNSSDWLLDVFNFRSLSVHLMTVLNKISTSRNYKYICFTFKILHWRRIWRGWQIWGMVLPHLSTLEMRLIPEVCIVYIEFLSPGLNRSQRKFSKSGLNSNLQLSPTSWELSLIFLIKRSCSSKKTTLMSFRRVPKILRRLWNWWPSWNIL